MGRPLFFGVAMGSIGIAASGLWNLLFALPGALSGDAPAEALVASLIFPVVLIVFSPVFAGLGIFLAAGIYHVSLMIVGGTKYGFDATLRAVSYAQTPQLLGVIPVCGSSIGGIWSLVLYVIGIKEIHETTTGKAVMAVLLPLIVCCCCIAILYATIGAAIIAAIAGGGWAAAGQGGSGY